jgi:hypothetical protein
MGGGDRSPNRGERCAVVEGDPGPAFDDAETALGCFGRDLARLDHCCAQLRR